MRQSEYYTDLWWKNRERTYKRRQWNGWNNALRKILFTIRTLSVPGRPTHTFEHPSAIAARNDVIYFPDLNKYRVRKLKAYVDAGCKAFMFRMGGPAQWIVGDPKWTIDPTYWDYVEEADKLGVLDQTIGYIVHDCFEPWSINGATGETDHTSMIDDWTTGGHMTRAFMYDHEVNKAWGAGREQVANGYTLKTSLAENTQNTWNKFHRTVSVYTADWFVNLTRDIWDFHDAYFTSINKPESEGGAGCQRPLMEAWYGQNMTKLYSDVAAVGADLFVPTPEQVGNLLWIGHQANSWQFSDRVKIAGSMPDGSDDTVGVDFNISLDPNKTFWYNFGLIKPGVTPPPPPPTGEYVTTAQYNADQAVVNSRLNRAEAHTHQTLGPTL